MPEARNPIADSVWVRPGRSRGNQPTLSREQIVRATVELLDELGLAGLTMRRLGARLGAGATSLYWYVSNKDDLLELAMDEVMAEIEIPDLGESGWRGPAAALSRGFRAMILRHPWFTGLLGVTPNIGPQAMRVTDRAIGLLTAAGFSGVELGYVSQMLLCHAIGAATVEAAWRRTATRVSATEMARSLSEYYGRDGAATYPSYTAWWNENKSLDVDKMQQDGFEFGLERLLDGVAVWLDRPK
jgi:AcrR family transcriptional regulator